VAESKAYAPLGGVLNMDEISSIGKVHCLRVLAARQAPERTKEFEDYEDDLRILLERHKPAKLFWDCEENEWQCPVCFGQDHEASYCPNCGQRLYRE
jgi:hypothetical protein